MAPPPVVTGLSPIEGPPGTRLTIRGENLGNKPTDLISLTICGCDCLLSAEWKSPKKIIARSGPGKGRGDIIVTTRLGGVGTCTVQFRGYYEIIGPMKESAVWVEEAPFMYIWGRRSLSPCSYQQDDPLGISVEGNERKFPEDDLHEWFPNRSGDIAIENFSPGWFLLENHHTTTFNDLRAGLSFLKRKVDGQKEGQLSFLKANVGSVVDQVDTLSALKDKFEKDICEHGTEPTLKLERAIKEAVRKANKLFDDVLSRRDRADGTRSALNVLTRFRFLFCLPCVINRNIKRGDYDIVINDYARVKNLFKKTEVPVFKTALAEIEKRVFDLQEMLHKKLKTMPISIEEQKRLIRYLINLESPYDPAWDAIKAHSEYMELRVRQCTEEHKLLEATEHPSASGKGKHKYNIMLNSQQNQQEIVPECVLFVEDLCEIMSTLFPDLWKLGQAYFTGELHCKAESSSHVEFKHMVLNIMDTFCRAVRSAIIPHTLDSIKGEPRDRGDSKHSPWITDGIPSWLPACLRYVRSAYTILIKLDLPGEALDIISQLILDLRLHSMNVLFRQATEQVNQLQKQETWKIELSGTYNGITNLPVKFEQEVQDVMQLVRESVLTNEQRESSLLENANAQKELNRHIELLLLSFHTVLKNLAFDNDEDDHTLSVREHRLLTTLANCEYTTSIILTNIEASFVKSNYPIPNEPFQNVKTRLQLLGKAMLEAYLELKSDPLVGTIEHYMYLGRFDWDTASTPHDIRYYAKECINNLISVHAEVYKISPALVESVLPQIVQTIAEELYRLMSCVQAFSISGNQQARADIKTLQKTFENFCTPKAKSFFNDALETIPPLEPEDSKIVEEVMTKCFERMGFHVICLTGQVQCNGPGSKKSLPNHNSNSKAKQSVVMTSC